MDTFLSDLYWHCIQPLPFSQDPEQEKAREEYQLLQEQVQEAMGAEFLFQYQRAEFFAHEGDHQTAFLQGLRFGARFMQLLPDQSPSPVSAP